MGGDGVKTDHSGDGGLGAKPWFRSLTIAGAVGYAAIQAAEGAGAIPAGTSTSVANFVQSLFGMLTVFGLRRAVGAGISFKF